MLSGFGFNTSISNGQDRTMLNEQKEHLLVLGLSMMSTDHHDEVLEEHLENFWVYHYQHQMQAIVPNKTCHYDYN